MLVSRRTVRVIGSTMFEQTHATETQIQSSHRWLFNALIGDKYFRPIDHSIGSLNTLVLVEGLPEGDAIETKSDEGTDNYNFLYWTNATDKEAATAKSVSSIMHLLEQLGVNEPLIRVAYLGRDFGSTEDVTQFAASIQEDLVHAACIDSPADFEDK